MAASPPRSIMELGLQRTGDDNLHRIVRARAMLAAAQRSAAMPVGRSGTSPTKVPKQYNKRGAPLTHCWSLAPNLFYIYIYNYIYICTYAHRPAKNRVFSLLWSPSLAEVPAKVVESLPLFDEQGEALRDGAWKVDSRRKPQVPSGKLIWL